MLDIYTLIEFAGFVGMTLIILGFFLTSKKKIGIGDNAYTLLNGLGGFLMVINTFYHGAFPATALNVFWVLITLDAWRAHA